MHAIGVMVSLAIVTLMLGSTVIADVAVTAVPGAESGRVDEEEDDSALRVVGRALLFLPRVGVILVATPVRAVLFVFERYEIEPRFGRVFFTEDETIGLYPTARIDSDYGVNLGARLVHRDLLGSREHFALSASRGGRYRDRVKLALRSGDRLGERVAVALSGEIDRRPKERFYGIGNRDDLPEVRHRQVLLRATGLLDVRAVGDLHVRGAAALSDIRYGRSETGPPIDEVYREQALAGWDATQQAYGELELRWDTRRRARRTDPPLTLSTGELVSAFVGRAHRLDAQGAFWRYGIELQHFLRLGEGPRVVVARFHGEGVTGDLTEVPFTELPQLGGKFLLRGYPTDRFRDRIATVGSLEYRWNLSFRTTATLFVDVGRVYPSLSDVGVEEMRVGYGVGLEYGTRSSFIGQLSLASSVDGGVFLNLAFDPVFDLDSRVERR